MKFKEFDTVRILRNHYPEVHIGDIGSIITIFDNPYEAYEIEFVNNNGETKAQCIFLPDEIQMVKN